MCGEQQLQTAGRGYGEGSPPRVRGTDANSFIVSCCVRITPACAGNSPAFTAVSDPLKDHPRVCGEQQESHMTSRSTLGSPPRVRGTVIETYQEKESLGITPACAGNSEMPPTA